MPQAIMLGADPEIFLTDSQTGRFVSAHEVSHLIRGDKRNPEKVNCGAIQIDGTALEFNIDPTNCEDEWVNNLTTVMNILYDRLPENLEFSDKVTARFQPTYFRNSVPQQAKRIGCDPDFSYYDGGGRSFPRDPRPIRYAGGHIHFGDNTPLYQVPSADLYLGLGSRAFDNDKQRIISYGQPGSYRRKPYGFEYRTLSNAWIMSEERMRWAFRMAQKAAKTGRRNTDLAVEFMKNPKSGLTLADLLPEDFEYVR